MKLKYMVLAIVIFYLVTKFKSKTSDLVNDPGLPQHVTDSQAFIHAFNMTSPEMAETVVYNGTNYGTQYPKTVQSMKVVWIEKIKSYLVFQNGKWIKLL